MQRPEGDMRENRGEERRQLYTSLQVYDGVSSRIVGHVSDLTLKGMRLVCKEPVGVQEEYRLRIKCPDLVDDRVELNVQAVCRWCREEFNPEVFVAGFYFQELSTEGTRIISILIDDFGVV